MKMLKPIAVLISDVHYNLQTIALADAAMTMAIEKSIALNVPLIVAGDLHDTKANLRGECIDAMIKTFAKACYIKPYVMIGNHDKINEKSSSTEHSLKFLEPYVHLVETPQPMENENTVFMIPYQHDPELVKLILLEAANYKICIMHQGCSDSNSGEYFQEKSALPKECFADFRVISGHYHSRQQIKCGRARKGAVGAFDYIGNPFTLNFGEANDPPKGFQILMSNGLLEFVPTNLRKHVVIEFNVDDFDPNENGDSGTEPGDLVWFKITGTKEQLVKIDRAKVAEYFNIETFKLDLIPQDTKTSQAEQPKALTQGPLLDSLIDSLTNTSDERKTRLKDLWKTFA